MYIKYSTGFLLASLVQAGIIMATEALGISTLGAKLTATQLLTHLLAGQALGYILLLTIKKFEFIKDYNIWIVGGTVGIIAWVVLLYINSAIGKVNAPWKEGVPTVISSIVAFIVFGLIADYTIKEYSYKKVH